MAGIIDAPMADLDARWRAAIGPLFGRLDLPLPPRVADAGAARTRHSDAFRDLHAQFTEVRRLDPEAAW